MCFNYSNVDLVNGKKVASNNYYCEKAVEVANPEEFDEYYMTLEKITNCVCDNE